MLMALNEGSSAKDVLPNTRVSRPNTSAVRASPPKLVVLSSSDALIIKLLDFKLLDWSTNLCPSFLAECIFAGSCPHAAHHKAYKTLST